MNLRTANISLLLGLCLFFGHMTEAVDYTCGLADYEPNSASSPHVVDSIRDNIPEGYRTWTAVVYGSNKGHYYYANDHIPYLDGTMSMDLGHEIFYFRTNNRTAHFVEEQGTRELVRRIVFKCSDGNYPEYSVIVPFVPED